jgi:hypothetical protein
MAVAAVGVGVDVGGPVWPQLCLYPDGAVGADAAFVCLDGAPGLPPAQPRRLGGSGGTTTEAAPARTATDALRSILLSSEAAAHRAAGERRSHQNALCEVRPGGAVAGLPPNDARGYRGPPENRKGAPGGRAGSGATPGFLETQPPHK